MRSLADDQLTTCMLKPPRNNRKLKLIERLFFRFGMSGRKVRSKI